jgi:regulator of cell morphogenesis and NO signaling
MREFAEVKKHHMEKLELYVPVVARVHGGSHPEFMDVQEVFQSLLQKLASADKEAELSLEFSRLREITSGYTVPADVCESYEAVYSMLAELDSAYHA